MNQFFEKYRTLSNTELLRIIENQFDYQEGAVEAAKEEIKQRKLTKPELEEAKQKLSIEQQVKRKQFENQIEIMNQLKKIGRSFFDSLNPIQHSAPNSERLIRLITIVFAFFSIYLIYNQFELIIFMLSESLTDWNYGIVVYMVPLILLPTATLLFGFRLKIGWILMYAYLTYSAVKAIGLLILTWNIEPTELLPIDRLFPRITPTTQILTILFFGGILWGLGKNDILRKFSINRQIILATVAVSVILTILFVTPF